MPFPGVILFPLPGFDLGMFHGCCFALCSTKTHYYYCYWYCFVFVVFVVAAVALAVGIVIVVGGVISVVLLSSSCC